MQDEHNFSWDTLEAMTLLNPVEIIAYHVYRKELNSKMKKTNLVKTDLQIIKTYLFKKNK